MVAAEDCVPNAVKKAGSMFFNIFNGFFPVKNPATLYWMSRTVMLMANIRMIILMKTANTGAICPLCVMERNMPNI